MTVFNQLKLLIVSKTRLKLLQVFLANPNKILYVRELSRLTKEQINSVRAELDRLEKAGLLFSENRANRKYYGIKRDYLFYDELSRMIAKIGGLGANIIDERAKLGQVKYAAMSNKFVKGLTKDPQDVDLIVVGNIVLPELARLVRLAEEERKQDVNYTAMTVEEFNFRKQRRDPFVLAILNAPKLMLIGEEEEFCQIPKI